MACASLGWAEACGAPVVRGATVACCAPVVARGMFGMTKFDIAALEQAYAGA